MSVTLLKLFVNTLKQNLPRHPYKSVSQFRPLTAMSVATENKEIEEIISNKKRTRFKRRQWESNEEKNNAETEAKKICERPVERIKRKKMAMLLGYSGVNYYGMQRNPGVPTIEEELLKALFEAKYITEEDFQNQQNAQFQRSSRTDKGVSASRQIVSLKLPLEIKVEEINSRLPDCIRVFGVKRVTNKFNCKTKCNARTYSYTMPTFTFDSSLVSDEDRKRYRISTEKLENIASALAMYKGAKNYHNFTERKHSNDPSATRYMMGFSVDRTFIHSEVEFAVLLVKGQSFMLHQIRKMIGLVIAVLRGHTDISMMEKAFSKEKVMIPTAPGLGLVLDMVHYERYAARYKESHDSLTWEEEEAAVQKFREEHIYPNIVKGELEGNSMATWLEKLARHSYDPADQTEKIEETGADDDDDDGACDDDDDKPDDDKVKTNNDTVKANNDEVKVNDGVKFNDDKAKIDDETKAKVSEDLTKELDTVTVDKANVEKESNEKIIVDKCDHSIGVKDTSDIDEAKVVSKEVV